MKGLRGSAAAGFAFLLAWGAPGASAALLLESFDVTLVDPVGGVNQTISVPSIGPGKELTAGGSGFESMLPNEYVDASGAQIVLGLEAGDGLKTGYGAGSYYEFSSLKFDPDTAVTLQVLLSNIQELSPPPALSGGSVRIALADLTMREATCAGQVNCGTVTLVFSPTDMPQIPEPTTSALLAAGLFALAALGRRARTA